MTRNTRGESRGVGWLRGRQWFLLCLAGVMMLAACSSGSGDETTTSTSGSTETTEATSVEMSDPSSEPDSTAGTDSTAGSDSTDTTATATTAAGEAQAGGDLVIANTGEPTTLHPYRYRATNEMIRTMQLYNTLVDYDTSDLSLVPSLAESWEVSSDGLAVTMTLRDDVTFHDGSDFSAADAKYSIDQARDPAADEIAPLLTSIESVDAPDDQTLVLNLSAPDRTVLNGLVKVFIVPDDPNIDYDNAPVGTGPFMLETWNRNVDMVFTKNENYWKEGQPYLDSITFKVVSEPSTQVLQLTNGEVDMVAPEVPFTHVESVEAAGLALPVDEIGMYDLRLNTRVEPWDDQRVRQALSLAIDREAIAEGLLGYMSIRSSIVDPDDQYFNPDAPTFNERDVERANELMAEAGYSDGASGSIIIHSDLGPQYEIIAQIVSQSAAEAGFDLEIESVDIGTWLERVYEQHEFNIGHSAFTVEPYAYAAISEGWSQSDGEAMGWAEQTPEFQDLLDGASAIVDDDQYRQAIFDMQQLGQESQARLILGGTLRGAGLSAEVQGFENDPLSRLFLESVWLEQ